MIGLEVFLVLLMTRLILPAGLMLLFGEWMCRVESRHWFG